MTSPYQPSFTTIHEAGSSKNTVYWMTHAGGAVLTLANRIRAIGNRAGVNVHAMQLPQREDFIDQTFDGDMNDLARLAADQIVEERKSASGHFALVGHSFGSVLAYRITAQLVQVGCPPDRLVVLSFPAPDRLSHEETLHRLSDQSLVEKVDQLFGGIPEGVRDDTEALAFFVPSLRSDLALLEGYQHDVASQVLPVPISAVCGTDDRAVDLAQMQRWQLMTSQPFRLLAMPGDHFFPLARMAEVLALATP